MTAWDFVCIFVMKLLSAKRCMLRISMFLIAIAVVAGLLFDNLKSAFVYNMPINSVILLSFFTGVFFIYRHIFLYDNEYAKLLRYETLKKTEIERLKLLSPVSFYISKPSNLTSQSKLNSVIDSVERRVEGGLAFSKYVSGVLIFLGLFGTFWGLSQTIGNVANIIDNLGIDQVDATESFSKLKDSLKIPLSGMGIAFGCSLFGLSGSLILGFLNVHQRRVADDFLCEVEVWITKHTVSLEALEANSEYHGQIFSMGLLEKTIEMIYAFQNQLKEFESNRITLVGMQREFSDRMSLLTNAISEQQNLFKTLGTTQIELHSMTKKINDTIWSEMLMKLDGINKSLEELVQGTYDNRDYVVENLGKDIRLISKTLSAMMRE